MVRRSIRSKKYNYNASSDSDGDPDYHARGGRMSKNSSMENIFSSLNGGVIKKMWEVRTLKSSPVTSTERGEHHKFPSKRKDYGKQGDGKIKKTCNLTRNRQPEDETDEETEFYTWRGYRRTSVEFEKKGSSRRKKRNSDNGNGQRWRKATIFSWLIDSKTVQEGASVFLSADHNNNTLLKKGILKREGIVCFCCNRIYGASGFTFHGGRRKNCQPYQSIFTIRKRMSLLSCMIQAWNKPEEFERRRFNRIETKGNNVSDPYDDACIICADGGNLMCCDECNSTYHQSCTDMEVVPLDSWYCPYCVCKFCGDPVVQNDYLLECPQCEKRYHWECHQRRELTRIDMNSIPCAPFCGQSCKEVREKLEKTIVGKKNKLDEGFSWTLLRQMDEDDDTGIYLDDTYQRTVCHSKLAVALRLMEDCFEPIVDRYTRIDLIPSVVYNNDSNFNRIQFRGFYTAVLEKDEEIISAASLRIHGTKLAEMPFIATSHNHRCKGMCKKLMVGIESALCYLDIQYLVIPSVSERIGSWIDKYGFELMEPRMEKEIMCHNTLMFHDSIRLQKSLVPFSLPESDRKCRGETSTKNHLRNCLSIRKQAMKVSSLIMDRNIEQSPKRNKKLLINNHDRDRVACALN